MNLKPTQLITTTLILLMILFLGVGANAQMPAPPVGFVHVNPPSEGAELIYSSPTIESHNWYGGYRLDVIGGAPGVGLWEADNSYRAGGASLEPVTAQDGVPILFQNALLTTWGALHHDGVDVNIEASVGNFQFYTTGVTNGLRVYNPGQVPTVVSTLYTAILHDASDGFVTTPTGNLWLQPGPGANVGIMDNLGGGDDYYWPNGDGTVNQFQTTNGANVLSWTTGDYAWVSANDPATNIAGLELENLSNGTNADALHTHAFPLWTTIAEANVVVAGADPTAFTGGAITGGAEDVTVAVSCRSVNGGIVWNALSHPAPVADKVTYYWYKTAGGNLEVAVLNDTQIDVLVTIFYCEP